MNKKNIAVIGGAWPTLLSHSEALSAYSMTITKEDEPNDLQFFDPNKLKGKQRRHRYNNGAFGKSKVKRK